MTIYDISYNKTILLSAESEKNGQTIERNDTCCSISIFCANANVKVFKN